ncbi:MAG: endonuclease/exonuclease/phosphatase family protein [Bacteroidales bacterium]|jgi:endonuclease/exonuclease/phosphatase family metal-dependent hydrolase|nr:endonuclease/exonuclease/phosphatase family protein [Bacteroidales bacterium]
MNNLFKYFVVIGALILAFSCNETSDDDPPFLDLSSKELIFWPEANQKNITVSANREFTAESSSLWCTADVISSSRDNLKISVTTNETVGEERTAEITITCDGISDILTVKQLAVEPSLSVKETTVVINEKESLDFSLEITTNIPIVFELPEWIQEGDNNEPVTGGKTYLFSAFALEDGTSSRTGDIIIRSKDPDINKNVIIPVRQNKENCILRVASYNIWVNAASWPSRKAMVNNIVRKYDFEIFGTQEGTKTHLTDITSDGTYAYIGEGRDGGGAGEYSAIIYKKDRFEVLGAGNFWYSETPEIPSRGWDAVNYNRICSWGKFRDKVSGREFYFFNSHFDHEGKKARLESSKLLLSRIKQITGDYPVFSTGDYNDTPTSEPIQTILNDGILKDSYVLSETPPYGSFGTINNTSNNTPTVRIDYIFVTSHVRIKEYGVLNDRPDGQFPSDHDPVLVVAEF